MAAAADSAGAASAVRARLQSAGGGLAARRIPVALFDDAVSEGHGAALVNVAGYRSERADSALRVWCAAFGAAVCTWHACRRV